MQKNTAVLENIENNCFGRNLKTALIELKAKHLDNPKINIFIGLSRQTIDSNLKIEHLELLDDISSIDRIKNIELLALWREYLSLRFPKEKREHLRKSVFYYLDVFTITKESNYLIHSLRLVKAAKGLFKKDLKSIYEISKNELFELNKPFLQKEIIVELFSLCPEKTKFDGISFLKDEIKKLTVKHDYSGIFWLIESLKDIKAISKTECKIMHAENYEKKGDYQSVDKKVNTYYPTILSTYQKGLQELKSIPCDDNLRKRLEKKVIQEQREHIKMHSAVSKEYIDESKILDNIINDFGDSSIEHYKIFDFHSGFNGIVSFPICFGSEFKSEPSNNYFFSKFFDTHTRIDSKGKVVGKTSREGYLKIEDKRFFRECIINFLKKAKWKMDEDKIIDRETVFYHIMEKCNSKFIPPERKWLYAKGIYAGFNNDFITAAHILIPQLENSFKFILESNGILTAKIYEEIQHDNMFGGLLDNLIKHNNHDIFYELKDFMLDNSSVNFRNELCHGLLSPFIIKHYGIYVWWLTLKMIFDNEKIFVAKSQ